MKKEQNNATGGIILIGLGVLFFISKWFDFSGINENWGLFILPALGAFFYIWGIATREGGLMIPGGVLSGVGVGSLLMESNLFSGEAEGGIFLISLGLGFASIALVTTLFANKKHIWSLIPGGILISIGAAILFGGLFMTVLTLIAKFWPVILILAGIATILKANRQQPKFK